MHNYTLRQNRVSFMQSFIECTETFENNSDMEVKVTQKKLKRAFVKETQ